MTSRFNAARAAGDSGLSKLSNPKIVNPTNSSGAPSSAYTALKAPTIDYNIDSVSSVIPELLNISEHNSAQSALEAQKLRDWQEAQNTRVMQFNAAEAAKNRDWQQMMSNTAHQREMADLKAAGLNPVLSAMNGNGASVGSGATASGSTPAGAKGEVDNSANAAIVSLLGTMLNAQTQLANQALSAQTQMAIADKQAASAQLVASITGNASLAAAGMTSAASKYNAGLSFQANRESIAQSHKNLLAQLAQDKALAKQGYEFQYNFRNTDPIRLAQYLLGGVPKMY